MRPSTARQMWVTALVSSVVTAAQSWIQSFLQLDGRTSSRLSGYWWAGRTFRCNAVTWLVGTVGRAGAANHRRFKRHTVLRTHHIRTLMHTRPTHTLYVPLSNHWRLTKCTRRPVDLYLRFIAALRKVLLLRASRIYFLENCELLIFFVTSVSSSKTGMTDKMLVCLCDRKPYR